MKFIRYLLVLFAATWFTSCSVNKKLTKGIQQLNADTLFNSAHIGFILQHEKTGKVLVAHNADKFFIPASNTKLLTTYAVLKTYPDSLEGWFFHETADTLLLKPNGDPTFLNDSFPLQKIFQKIVSTPKVVVIEKTVSSAFSRLGSGWSWSSYQESYMPERLAMPIYGNVVKFKVQNGTIEVFPSYFRNSITVNPFPTGKKISVSRAADHNAFTTNAAAANALLRPFTQKEDPSIAYHLLADTLAKRNKTIHFVESQNRNSDFWKPFYTQKTQEVLQPMMHNSDNFLAEQLLLMAGSKLTGKLSDRLTISKLQKEDFKDFSQPFIWVDGSGLSRNNNISPRVISELLLKMKTEFGWDKISAVLQKGNEGTVKGYYKGYENNIWSKTGTLGGSSTTLSGYLISKKGNNYTFSFLVNNHHKSAVAVRKAIEKYLVNIIDNY
ncbi:D-alanyl-D-alanine carboxypeptidase/endopeptidase [compost metagenome]